MCEQIAPYLQLAGGDLNTLALSTCEDRWNLVQQVIVAAAKGEKDFNSAWGLSSVWELLDKTKLKKADAKKFSDKAINGWATGPIVDSHAGKFKALGSEYRTPGHYRLKESGNVRLGATNEMMHPSIQHRLDRDDKYQPAALGRDPNNPRKLFKRVSCLADKVTKKPAHFEWTDGDVTVSEYVIKPTDYFTRHVAMQDGWSEGDSASDFIGHTDLFLGADTSEARSVTTKNEHKTRQ